MNPINALADLRPKNSGLIARSSHAMLVITCVALLSPGHRTLGQGTEPQVATPTGSAAPAEEVSKIPNDQLDSLVAPIALYPDPLLAQTLAASTYPLEIIQLEQWMKKNKNLKGKALADAVEKQNWDPSVQAMTVFPDVVKQLAENVSWTSDLGNAFLAQEADVMDAAQRMRAKAQAAGNLKSSQQQKVENKTVESKNVIVIEQADPEIVYVPSYNPTVVYGAPVYPYPSIYYPPGYGLLAFGAGVAIGAAWGNGGWGYGCGWGHGDVDINVNNKYVNNWNKNNINNANFNKANFNQANTNSRKWQHNPQHRGSAPYGDRNTANRFGGNARQQPAGGPGNRPAGGGAGIANRPGGSGARTANRPGGGGAGTANRPGGGAGGNPPGGGAGIGAGGGRVSTMPATRPSGGGATHIGNQNLGGSSNIGSRGVGGGGGSPNFSSRGGGFGGGGGGSASHASSMRGGSSMGGGGFSRGGGGGHRGGGGRRR